MLRELLEREDWGVAAGALSFLAAVIWPFVCMAGPTAIVFTFAMISLFLALAGFSQRTTLFEAALPIPGRELVAARLSLAGLFDASGHDHIIESGVCKISHLRRFGDDVQVVGECSFPGQCALLRALLLDLFEEVQCVKGPHDFVYLLRAAYA